MKYTGNSIDFVNDIKVLGRVVSIATDNKLAESEQIFDSTFKYEQQDEAGADQYSINRLFKDKIYSMEEAGLIPDNGVIIIDYPVIFNNNTKFNELIMNSIDVADNITAGGDITADHKITGNDIEARQTIKGGAATFNTLNVTSTSTFGGKATFNNGIEITAGGINVHGDSKFFNNVTVDGDIIIDGTSLKQRLTTIEQKITNIENRFNTIETQIATLNTQITNKYNELKQYIDNKVSTINNEITNITNNMPGEPDLSNYYTKSEINNNYYTKVQVDQLISGIGEGTVACLWQYDESTNRLTPITAGANVATSGKFYSGI